MIQYKRASNTKELDQIIALQQQNLNQNVSTEDKNNEGFLSVQHDLEILTKMNDDCPHIIAKSNDLVVGYALCMHKKFANNIEVLKPMFMQIESAFEKNINYVTMGQICIDKAFRRQGIFKGLYEFMKNELTSKFDMVITEVDSTNLRSLNAHKAVGFKSVKSYKAGLQTWVLVYWNWK